MDQVQLVRANEPVLGLSLSAMIHIVARQLMPASHRTHASHVKNLTQCMAERNLPLQSCDRNDLGINNTYSAEMDAKATEVPMYAVARSLLDEAVQYALRQRILLKAFKTLRQIVMKVPIGMCSEKKEKLYSLPLFKVWPFSKRGCMFLMLLMGTGVHISEVTELRLGDPSVEQGYDVFIIRHDKGKERDLAKPTIEVRQSIDCHLETAFTYMLRLIRYFWTASTKVTTYKRNLDT